mmetsp:Transcript_62254/g.145990  ORF Transcript_62254/g.145990 Transcript_62254/m.145990 type:complete len:287 (-) Transcript_62254:267-1127(-)
MVEQHSSTRTTPASMMPTIAKGGTASSSWPKHIATATGFQASRTPTMKLQRGRLCINGCKIATRSGLVPTTVTCCNRWKSIAATGPTISLSWRTFPISFSSVLASHCVRSAACSPPGTFSMRWPSEFSIRLNTSGITTIRSTHQSQMYAMNFWAMCHFLPIPPLRTSRRRLVWHRWQLLMTMSRAWRRCIGSLWSLDSYAKATSARPLEPACSAHLVKWNGLAMQSRHRSAAKWVASRGSRIPPFCRWILSWQPSRSTRSRRTSRSFSAQKVCRTQKIRSPSSVTR